MSPRIKSIADRVIRMMADQLLLEPAVDLTDHAACEARWQHQRIATIAIQEFGGEAKALAQIELHQLAGDAGRSVSPPAISASMTERRDGVCVSGNPSGGRDAA